MFVYGAIDTLTEVLFENSVGYMAFRPTEACTHDPSRHRQGFIVLDDGRRRGHAINLAPRVESSRPGKSVAERCTREHQVPHGQIDILSSFFRV